MKIKQILVVFFTMLFWACKDQNSLLKNESLSPIEQQFRLLTPQQTGVNFVSGLKETADINVLIYEYFYNGGGVATADFNGDDLIDIYFTSSMSPNRLYLNKGNMEFKEVTEQANVGSRKGSWKTGVTHVDINADGKLDIFLCYSGALPPVHRKNQLFINTGNNEEGIPIFEEQATKYGLDSPAFSNQGYFFDFDKDGDLDMLLLNHNPQSLPNQNVVAAHRMLSQPDSLMGVRLYRQHNERFQDITEEAGISGSALTYGLGIGMGDLNQDGWTDFYLCNDYDVPDYLYINNKDGTFTDNLAKSIGHISNFSMGNDIADINNDGLADIISLDMLPETNERQKLLMFNESYTKFDMTVSKNFHHQNMRNMLQLNNGDGTFSEIGQLAGIDKTDWSWSPLLADFDNDGYKDLHVTNGYFRDFTNSDFINYMDEFTAGKGVMKREDVLDLVKHAPQSNFYNYIFKNLGNGRFSNVSKPWGLRESSNSNGAAYADLDNDGDLDLVVNNINKPAFIYENLINVGLKSYLSVKLYGEGRNTNGIGAKVQVFNDGQIQEVSQFPSRGYLSTISPVLHFGLGESKTIDSLKILWESGKSETLKDISGNQALSLWEKNANINSTNRASDNPIFVEIQSPIEFMDPKSNFRDFDRQSLLPFELSHTSPFITKGFLDNDTIPDLFIGGSKGLGSKIFLGDKSDTFENSNSIARAMGDSASSHVVGAIIFDANSDGFNDVYIANGGYHDFDADSQELQDRLYLNDGNGFFKSSKSALPKTATTSTVAVESDINGDGHLDIFVAGGYIPGRYPETSPNQILINDGNGNFSDEIRTISPKLERLSVIKDALWTDINQDGVKDLFVVGHWMPISVFINENGKLIDKTQDYFMKELKGWWNTIESADFNDDGRPDFVMGNIGLNTQFQASENEPIELVYADFDSNGSIDPILNQYKQGKSYPDVSRDALIKQLSFLGQRFPSYESYANQGINDVFGKKALDSAKKLEINHLETSLLLSTREGHFKLKSLPGQVQYAPVKAIQSLDYDLDGKKDLVVCGNNSYFKITVGKADANYGLLLKGDGKGNFTYINQSTSGFKLIGDVKSIVNVGEVLLFGINQDEIRAFVRSRK